MTRVRLNQIGKQYGDTMAVTEVDLDVGAGELFFLLGPSGCGKTTLLRIIAGLIEPTRGQIRFNDRDVTDLGTESRNAVMCFQNYALWPHLSVRENVEFGLNMHRMPRADKHTRVDETLQLVRMFTMADRRPNALSGGQQQRVALARALAVRPDCLLLDEPLSNLDTKLRLEMRSEIRRICKIARFTTIYVTHDQQEALSIADRIAVMCDGRICQVGKPADLYNKPATSFVADFLGQTNLLPGRILSREPGMVRVQTSAGRITCATTKNDLPDSVIVSVRPEHIEIAPEGLSISNDQTNRLSGELIQTMFLGESAEYTVRIGQPKLKVLQSPPRFCKEGPVTITFAAAHALALAE